MAGGNGNLLVNIDTLKEYAAYLSTSKTQLTDLMTTLKSQMAAIESAWKDNEGSAIKAKYDAFIAQADVICAELQSLSKYASDESTKYEGILTSALQRMG